MRKSGIDFRHAEQTFLDSKLPWEVLEELWGQIADVAGPLGQPTHVKFVGHAVVVGGGVGTAVVYPQALALKAKRCVSLA